MAKNVGIQAQLTISSKTYSAWSLRGWLLCKLAGLEVEELPAPNDAGNRAELLLLSPSVLVPRLTHDGASVWDTLAIAEYLNEHFPKAGMYPAERIARAHCRSIAGEIHSGFTNLRSALPMNLKVIHEKFPIFPGAKPDIGEQPTVADAMYAPVTRRFLTYAVPVSPQAAAYCKTIANWAPMQEWLAAAQAEPEEVEELEVEF